MIFNIFLQTKLFSNEVIFIPSPNLHFYIKNSLKDKAKLIIKIVKSSGYCGHCSVSWFRNAKTSISPFADGIGELSSWNQMKLTYSAIFWASFSFISVATAGPVLPATASGRRCIHKRERVSTRVQLMNWHRPINPKPGVLYAPNSMYTYATALSPMYTRRDTTISLAIEPSVRGPFLRNSSWTLIGASRGYTLIW